MAKSKIVETHRVSAEGILDIDTDTGMIVLDVEDIGEKNLADLLVKFNGANVKVVVSLNADVTE